MACRVMLELWLLCLVVTGSVLCILLARVTKCICCMSVRLCASCGKNMLTYFRAFCQ